MNALEMPAREDSDNASKTGLLGTQDNVKEKKISYHSITHLKLRLALI